MAQRKKSRGHRHSGAAVGLSGAAHTPTLLHSVDTLRSTTSRDGSIWGRRRVLLLNSTYEPLTALPMRRAVGTSTTFAGGLAGDVSSTSVSTFSPRRIAIINPLSSDMIR